MNTEQAEKKINILREELQQHNHNYYVLNQPKISDFDFDQKLEELRKLEEQFPEFADENSPTKRVGGDITDSFPKVRHQYPMLSLSNTYSIDEIREWEVRVKKAAPGEVDYVCELKYDGIAIGIRYKKGNLFSAVTRGDGDVGEEITANVKTIRSIPLRLHGKDFPDDFEIRGEIFMPIEKFTEMNAERVENGEEPYMNPRNTASGTLKLQDSAVVAKRQLDCFLYGLYGENLPANNHFDNIQAAGNWGFKIPPASKNYILKCANIEEIEEFINYWNEERGNLLFEIDGVVLKVNSYSQQDELGFTAKSPRWAVAYKFKAERVSTLLNKITYQVGRTGAITPVANLKPVLLGGSSVKRASLHNADQIEKLDIREGDTVFVEKGGEVIPKIIGVDFSRRPTELVKNVYITKCPECDTELVRNDGEAAHYCPNANGCPPQIKGKIEHFISRKAMNIDGLGVETVGQLFEAGLISNPADLYDLTMEQVLPLERMAEKSARNLIEGLEKSKEIPFERVLFALGIRYVGETVAKKLVQAFKNIEAIKNAGFEELIAVEEIGERIAESVIAYLNVPKNLEIIDRLQAKGLNFELEEKEVILKSTNLLDKSFVVSGVFSKFSRNDIKKAIEDNGGKNVSSISAKTDFVVAGENMGPAKLDKAKKLNIPIISEEDFIAMIN